MIGLEVEGLFITHPKFAPRLRPRLFAEGLRYERRVMERLKAECLGARLYLGPWLAGPCQPDAILEFHTSILLIEIKLSACDITTQTAKYIRALGPTGKQVWVVQIVRNVSGSRPPTITSLYDIRSTFEILHWWL